MEALAVNEEIDLLSKPELITRYTPIVKRIARHLSPRLPAVVQLDDLIQAGMVGLLEAAKRYDATKGASFETYASIRVRGAMLDDVRKNDWLPRSVYQNSRRITAATHETKNRLGREAKAREIAETMGVKLKDYHQMIKDVSLGQLYAIEQSDMNENKLKENVFGRMIGPLEELQKSDFNTKVAETIENLPKRESMVLLLYYNKDLNLKEVGEVLGVSESRVCQIHNQAMSHLQSQLNVH